MFDPNNYRPILRIGLYSLIAYVAIAYIVFITMVIHYEISLFSPAEPVATRASIDRDSYGIVSSRIHNVFGDPIPYAVVHLNGRIAQADSTGHFTIEEIYPNRYDIEIFAGGYGRYRWGIQVEEGINTPVIKYDTGLWPQFFLTDFHVFHHNSDKIFSIIGFANGSNEPLYIHRVTIYSPRNETPMELLDTREVLEHFLSLSGKLSLVENPQVALRLAPQSWFSGSLPPLDGPAAKGTYTLEVHVGTEDDHERGAYRVDRIKDHLDMDSNWNPHLP